MNYTDIIGDVDGNNNISDIDMQLIFAHKSGRIKLTADELERADTDLDGQVTLADALKIKKHLSGEEILDGVIRG